MIPIYSYDQVSEETIFSRNEPTANVTAPVAEILAQVKTRGDGAVLEYTERFDGCALETLAVTEAEIKAAFDAVEPEFLAVLEKAAENIRAFHAAQLRQSLVLTPSAGVVLG